MTTTPIPATSTVSGSPGATAGPRWLRLPLVLQIDAVANLAGALALAALASYLAPAAGLDGPGAVHALAALLGVNGLANAAVRRRPARAGVRVLVAVDAAFAVVVGAVAILDPTGAEPEVRWALAALAELTAIVAATKVWTGRAANLLSQAP